jgi:peptide/nickel transport system substrate-binding protein
MFGIRQLSQNLTFEGIARIGEDGRMQPFLAESWSVGADGRSVSVKFRANVKFHDGTPLDARTVASLLPEALRSLMGTLYSDIDRVMPSGTNSVEVAFRERSPFLTEVLEVQIRKPGEALIGTGPFAVSPNSGTELHANNDYYLGRPVIASIKVETYPSIRAAWAEMLRGRLDFLYEVGPDALDSMRNSTTAKVFTFTRRYQHVLVFNTASSALQSRNVRRALGLAIDRSELIKRTLNEYGVASVGPIWPQYWALDHALPPSRFDPQGAAHILNGGGRPLRFTCLVSPDAVDERIALELKRQLSAVGVEMQVEQASRDEIVRRAAKREYEAALTEIIGGPTLLRLYLIWHSAGALNWGAFGTAAIDAALDRARRATSEESLVAAVGELERTFADDAPALFLAWSVRARAVSRRFEVPDPEEGREILSNLRLWKPVDAEREAAQN